MIRARIRGSEFVTILSVFVGFLVIISFPYMENVLHSIITEFGIIEYIFFLGLIGFYVVVTPILILILGLFIKSLFNIKITEYAKGRDLKFAASGIITSLMSSKYFDVF